MRKNVYVGSETPYNSSSLTHGRPKGSKNKDVKYIAIDPKTNRYIYENSSMMSPSNAIDKTAYKKSELKSASTTSTQSDYEKWRKDRIEGIRQQVANTQIGPDEKAKKPIGKGGAKKGGAKKGGGGSKAKAEPKAKEEKSTGQASQSQEDVKPVDSVISAEDFANQAVSKEDVDMYEQYKKEMKDKQLEQYKPSSKVAETSNTIAGIAQSLGISSYTSATVETSSGLSFSCNASPEKTQAFIDELKKQGYYMTGVDTANGVEISMVISPKT